MTRQSLETPNLRLVYARIIGFKSILHGRIGFGDTATLLVGPNGSGKSNVLQAIEFARHFLNGDPLSFINDRGWSTSDIRTFGKARTIRLMFVLQNLINDDFILWSFSWNTVDEQTIQERVGLLKRDTAPDDLDTLLSYRRKDNSIVLSDGETIDKLVLRGSALSILNTKNRTTQRDNILDALRLWFTKTLSLELLNPNTMRTGTRGTKSHIGKKGEHLASFMDTIYKEKYTRILKRLQRLYPAADALHIRRKRAGWLDMRLNETYHDIPSIRLQHVSDGFLRLLAICCIPEFENNITMVLLDEIEDGIDPHILPNVISILQDRDTLPQIVMTSHSPIVANFFEGDAVNFVDRDDDGYTITAMKHEMPGLEEYLEDEYLGEVWMNTESSVIVEWIKQAQDYEDKNNWKHALFRLR